MPVLNSQICACLSWLSDFVLRSAVCFASMDNPRPLPTTQCPPQVPLHAAHARSRHLVRLPMFALQCLMHPMASRCFMPAPLHSTDLQLLLLFLKRCLLLASAPAIVACGHAAHCSLPADAPRWRERGPESPQTLCWVGTASGPFLENNFRHP